MEQILTQCRVANLVEIYNRATGEWEVYQITHRDFPELKYREELFRGIPLTEEWLLRFDFFRHHEDYFNSIIYIKNVVGKTEFKWGVYTKEVGSGVQIKDSFLLKYVHQLQNLYHALAGEELIVK